MARRVKIENLFGNGNCRLERGACRAGTHKTRSGFNAQTTLHYKC